MIDLRSDTETKPTPEMLKFKNIMVFKYLIFVLAIIIVSFPIKAQDRKVIVCDKPSDEKDYKRWLEKDAFYIITKIEKKEFLNLKTNEARENFINDFWLKRDPTPETEENEFREDYYERIAFANENFASGIQGWRTDRGFVYIAYGKPDRIEKTRGDFEGLTDILVEKWLYKYLDSEGSNIEFIFLDPTESNEFRLEKEKREKLLKNIGTGLKICFNCPLL